MILLDGVSGEEIGTRLSWKTQKKIKTYSLQALNETILLEGIALWESWIKEEVWLRQEGPKPFLGRAEDEAGLGRVNEDPGRGLGRPSKCPKFYTTMISGEKDF